MRGHHGQWSPGTPPQGASSLQLWPLDWESEPREAQMSTALGQVTGDLWLLAHLSTTVRCLSIQGPPSLAQGPALPESGDIRKPGSESLGPPYKSHTVLPRCGVHCPALVHKSLTPLPEPSSLNCPPPDCSCSPFGHALACQEHFILSKPLHSPPALSSEAQGGKVTR